MATTNIFGEIGTEIDFTCGHSAWMRVEDIPKFHIRGLRSQTYCPRCKEVDNQAEAEETIRRMEMGLGIE